MPAQGISKQGPERPPLFCSDLVGRCFSHRQELCVGTYTRVDEAVPAKGPYISSHPEVTLVVQA